MSALPSSAARSPGRRSPLSPVLRSGLVALALSGWACSNDQQAATAPGLGEVGPAGVTSAVAPDSWTPRRSMPDGREGLAVGVVPNAVGEPILYALGGYVGTDTPVPTNLVFAYNFSNDTWTTRSAHGGTPYSNGVGVINGKLYQSGGIAGTRSVKTFTVYDPATDAFTTKAPLPIASASGVTAVISGKLYVLTGAGGNCSCTRTKRLFRYDPASDAWTALRAAPDAHIGGAGGMIGGKFYVAGGRDGAGGISDKVHVYNPATNTWKTLASLPEPAADVAGAVLSGKLYVIAPFSTWAYDPATNTWAARAPLGFWRHHLAAASFVSKAGNPRILAVGGIGDPGWPDARNEVYTP